jgi:hypothetical protein
MEVQSVSALRFDSFSDQVQKWFSRGSCISTDKNSNGRVIDSESSFDQKSLEIGNSQLQTVLIDKFLNFGLNILLEHIPSEVGDFDSIVLFLVVTG